MSRLKSIRLPASANLKIFLVLMAFAIVTGTLWYTQRLVDELKGAERKTIELTTSTMESLLNSTSEAEVYTTEDGEQVSNPVSATPATNFLVELLKSIEFPLIVTGVDREPIGGDRIGYSDWVKNVDLDTSMTATEQRQFLKTRIEEMSGVYEPVVAYTFHPRMQSVRVGDSTVQRIMVDAVGVPVLDSIPNYYFFYDDSKAIKELGLLPYVEITIVAMFILVGYIGFSHVKRNEQSNIWVGMAKETAHQLGTPLSSLMGWVELLRYMPDDSEQVLEAAGEMERDIDRLKRVAHRFSKIGSAAELKNVEIGAVLRTIIRYFERRLPHLGKKVILELDAPEPAWVAINVDLFEWVFENLVRNAADAIDRADGEIRFHVQTVRDTVVIDISDNGRGIDPKIRKDIFRPGFSTKQRGWGLGLSLARRIVEDYHKGKITIKESSPEGTTFRIRLSAARAPAEIPSSPQSGPEPIPVGRTA